MAGMTTLHIVIGHNSLTVRACMYVCMRACVVCICACVCLCIDVHMDCLQVFFMLKGSMVLKIMECGTDAKDIVINEGEVRVFNVAVYVLLSL